MKISYFFLLESICLPGGIWLQCNSVFKFSAAVSLKISVILGNMSSYFTPIAIDWIIFFNAEIYIDSFHSSSDDLNI